MAQRTHILVARFKIGHTPRKNRLNQPQPPASSHIVSQSYSVIIAHSPPKGKQFILFFARNIFDFFVQYAASVLLCEFADFSHNSGPYRTFLTDTYPGVSFLEFTRNVLLQLYKAYS